MGPLSEKILPPDRMSEKETVISDTPDYQERAIFFAQAVLATARAFPTRATPEIPDREYTAVVQRVKDAAAFLISEGLMRPRFTP